MINQQCLLSFNTKFLFFSIFITKQYYTQCKDVVLYLKFLTLNNNFLLGKFFHMPFVNSSKFPRKINYLPRKKLILSNYWHIGTSSADARGFCFGLCTVSQVKLLSYSNNIFRVVPWEKVITSSKLRHLLLSCRRQD